MQLIVQKFGGTSVATSEARELVYKRIISTKKAGKAIIAVVSAMGRRGAPYATDTLLDLVQPACPQAREREQTLMQFCGEIIAGSLVTANLQQLGFPATYLTGQQAGLITTADFDEAEILRVESGRVRSLLQAGEIVVVAGGQGATPEGEITSLGRGGSDITACALGVALDAEQIEIYSDVEGIMTADPQLVDNAKPHGQISHADCHQLALQGAKVMHPRAVEVAATKPAIPLWVKSVFSDSPGTLIGGGNNPAATERARLLGVTVLTNQTLLQVAAADALKVLSLPRPNYGEFQIRPLQTQADGTIYLSTPPCHAKHIIAMLVEQGISYTLKTGMSCVSLVGNQLQNDEACATAYIAKVKSSGCHAYALERNEQALSVWVAEKEAQALARAIHRLLE